MSVRSLNKVMLIGNLTRDPELRYTPSGTAVCTFGLATNRSWTTQTGETKEETEFHRIVAWNKLGELCSQLLAKGRKVYVEGRLTSRTWTGQDGAQRTTVEIVIEDMIILESRKTVREGDEVSVPPSVETATSQTEEASKPVQASQGAASQSHKGSKKKDKQQEAVSEEKTGEENISPDDIPF